MAVKVTFTAMRLFQDMVSRIGRRFARENFIDQLLYDCPLLKPSEANALFNAAMDLGTLMYFKQRDGTWIVRELPMGLKMPRNDN